MLQMWLDRNGVKATDEQLSAGLKGIGREDLCYLLEDPVFHYGAVDPSLHMDKHMHYD
uniref:Death domain-containing protein n=1 Tax=Ciona savignyi TaxID=51511 RepID=H2YKZ1_CIOSA